MHQEIALCPDISVAENIFMAETNARRGLWMDTKSLRRRAEAVLADLHPVPVTALAGELPIASQQIVEIAKALTLNCKVLIFDEPTAALTEAEAERLFAIIRGLKARGIGIIYISHRMAEIFAISDRITVLRDGAFVDTLQTAATTPEAVAAKMVGRALPDLYPPRGEKAAGEPILKVVGLSDGGIVDDVSFEVRAGEIVGLGGLIGSGRTETVKAVCGLSDRSAGSIYRDGKEIAQGDYLASIREGIVYLSEDRKGDGVFLDLSIAENISALDLKRVSGRFMVRRGQEAALAETMRERLGIRCASVHQPVSDALGRQPAEGGAGEAACRQPARALRRRADARRRHRRQGADLRDPARPRRPGRRHRRDLVGTAGTDRHQRPHTGAARGPDRRRGGGRRHERGDDHAACLGACRAHPVPAQTMRRCGHERDPVDRSGRAVRREACPPA